MLKKLFFNSTEISYNDIQSLLEKLDCFPCI